MTTSHSRLQPRGLGLYVLDGHTPVQVDNFIEWAKRFELTDQRVVACSKIGDVRVSTVFLGIDHAFFGGGPPLLFETMILGGTHDCQQWRCTTWETAEDLHAQAVRLVSE